VLAPLDDEAVVLALAMVPDEMLLALIAVIAVPSPLNEEAVITLDPKLPEASRSTIVLALFDVLPVVRALSIVPELIFEALICANCIAPVPDTLVNAPVVPLNVVALAVVKTAVSGVESTNCYVI